MTLRRKPRPIWRPPASVPLTRDAAWKKLCAEILKRDPVCRRCGARTSDVVDHIIPRRLFGDRALADDPSNLSGLCSGACHPDKTMVVERKLYAGDVQIFKRWLDVLKKTGPIPSGLTLAAAYARLTQITKER